MKTKEEYKENFINKSTIKHNGQYDYSKVNYINSRTPVKIICNIHGLFEQTPDNHLYTFGCQKCSLYNAHKREKSNTDDFIRKAQEIHGKNTYDYSKVEYHTAKVNVTIICLKEGHGEFKKWPSNHLSGQGCPFCSLEKCNIQNNIVDFDKFVNRSNKIHNNKYDYTECNYKNTSKKIWIKCPTHGKFLQSPTVHMSGRGCPKCGVIQSHKSFNKTTKQFIKEAKEAHGDLYDYSKTKYINYDTKIIIICGKHGEREQYPYVHIKHGCNSCNDDNKRLSNEEFIRRANKLYNNKYDYSETNYRNKKSKLTIICPQHGKFEKNAADHLHGRECPKCNLCPSCQLWRTMGKLCAYCKPKNKNKLYQKTKEMEIVKFLKEKLPDNEFIHNKSVGKDCTEGHLFPDILFDCDYYNLIVEIDEHKHRGADYKCDEKRMYDIIAKLGMPCVFIRYNPDSKNSDKEVLLNTVEQYLNLKNKKVWDEYGFKVDYLFY